MVERYGGRLAGLRLSNIVTGARDCQRSEVRRWDEVRMCLMKLTWSLGGLGRLGRADGLHRLPIVIHDVGDVTGLHQDVVLGNVQ